MIALQFYVSALFVADNYEIYGFLNLIAGGLYGCLFRRLALRGWVGRKFCY